ncbi:tyrosine protein phosphatase [Halobacillus salinarum]|uniref:Tyrosine-protein phosphatase n=1 Tax=Halobacillus salinarum TaxID=2932257 RepID=A0ABY4EP26_9BACI|nr:CpsB/CapC family capsule biosynthesis tyrosine phosphatase [Halobacillus salinarum]UOQ45389.1 tyrosine protein phosphatase [Halobacillus salinarum]
MIDIHSHILPGVDDGAQTTEDSLDMARAAVEDGIHTIIATPHHRNGKYDNYKTDILTRVKEFNQQLENHNIPLTVLPGQETRIQGDMIEGLEHNKILPINEDSGYVFVEFPSDHVPRYSKRLLFDIQVAGYKPVIVHPERNSTIIQHPNILFEMVEKGSLTQITAASLVGKFGKKIKRFTHQLIEANLTHLIASDAHNTTTRGFCMKDAFAELEENYGSSMVYLFAENAGYLVNGEVVVSESPLEIKKKKFLGVFG